MLFALAARDCDAVGHRHRVNFCAARDVGRCTVVVEIFNRAARSRVDVGEQMIVAVERALKAAEREVVGRGDVRRQFEGQTFAGVAFHGRSFAFGRSAVDIFGKRAQSRRVGYRVAARVIRLFIDEAQALNRRHNFQGHVIFGHCVIVGARVNFSVVLEVSAAGDSQSNHGVFCDDVAVGLADFLCVFVRGGNAFGQGDDIAVERIERGDDTVSDGSQSSLLFVSECAAVSRAFCVVKSFVGREIDCGFVAEVSESDFIGLARPSDGGCAADFPRVDVAAVVVERAGDVVE